MMTEKIIEIEEILAALYDVNDNKKASNIDYIMQNLTMDIGQEYNRELGGLIQQRTRVSKRFRILLSLAQEDLCKNNRCEHCELRKYCSRYVKDKIERYDKNTPTIVDLFCGAGGLSLGFSQEGFRTSLANDIEPCCIETYSHNHPETPRKHIVLGDINHVISNINTLLRFKEVDVVVGGPPCQGFSMANRQRIIDDPRNILYKSYVKVVSIIRPKYFVMENVKGMLAVASQVLEDFSKIGYTVTCKVLNAKDFGVPQNRERLIFIGNRVGEDNEAIFTEIINYGNSINRYVLDDALFGLRTLQASRIRNSTEQGSIESGHRIEKNKCMDTSPYLKLINGGEISRLVYNHKARFNNDRDIEIYGRMSPGDKSDDPKIADIMPYGRRNSIFKDKYYKLEGNRICKTITAHMKFDCNMYIHPNQSRGLTPREAARVQSYPDDYFFTGAYTKTYMQIGNSVPPLLGRAIAKIIKKHLRGNK